MAAALTVETLTALFRNKSNTVLLNTIKNSQARIDRIRKMGLGNTVAEQNEINRIQAAVDVLAARGYYDGAKQNAGGIPQTVTGPGGLVHQPWFKPAALVFAGFVLFRKVL